MRTTCPHCQKEFDVSIKTVLEWISRSAKLKSAVDSMATAKARAARKPENQRRNVDYAELARKSHEKRRDNSKKT